MPNQDKAVCTADHNIGSIPQTPMLPPPGSNLPPGTMIPQSWVGCVECGKTLDEIRADLKTPPKRTRSPRKKESANVHVAAPAAAPEVAA